MSTHGNNNMISPIRVMLKSPNVIPIKKAMMGLVLFITDKKEINKQEKRYLMG